MEVILVMIRALSRVFITTSDDFFDFKIGVEKGSDVEAYIGAFMLFVGLGIFIYAYI